MKALFTVLIFLVSISRGFSQFEIRPLYSFQVQGVASVTPDMAVVSVAFRKSGGEVAGQGINQVFRDIDIDPNFFGIKEESITRSVTSRDSLGYILAVTVSIFDLDKLEPFLVQFEKRGVEVIGVTATYSKLAQLKFQAHQNALLLAKQQVVELNKTTGNKLGKLFRVKELAVRNTGATGLLPETSQFSNPIANKINIVVDLEVSYELL